MFCSKCGFQITDGAAFCPGCGNKIEVAPAAPVQPVYQAPVAPAAPVQPVYQAPVAPVAPAQPVYDPMAPMYTASMAPQPAPKKNLAWLWALIGVIVAAAITVGVLFATGVIGGSKSKGDGGVPNDPESVAEAYVKASLESDMKKQFSLMAGDMQAFFEEVQASSQEAYFEYIKTIGSHYDLELEVESWDDFYAANKEIAKANNEENFGEGYKVTIETEEAEDIDEAGLEILRVSYDTADYADYIDVEEFEEGKTIKVTVIINDKEGEEVESYDRTITVIKYNGKWKVLER